MRSICFLLLLCTFAASAQKKKIQPSQLPEVALTFIEENIRTAALHQSYKFTENGSDRFKVVMADDTEVNFDSNGNWTEVDGQTHPIPSAFLPAPMIDYLKKNHPGIRIKKARKDGKKFTIDLIDNTNLNFDLTGKFLKKS